MLMPSWVVGSGYISSSSPSSYSQSVAVGQSWFFPTMHPQLPTSAAQNWETKEQKSSRIQDEDPQGQVGAVPSEPQTQSPRLPDSVLSLGAHGREARRNGMGH